MVFFLSQLALQEEDIEEEEYMDQKELEQQEESLNECSLISHQHCRDDGFCEYCAMCLRESCIMDKSSCNPISLNTTDIYDWHDYCLTDKNSSSKSNCTANLECYQYHKGSERSNAHAWRSLTCDPNSCMLVRTSYHSIPPPMSPVSLPDSHNQPKKIESKQEKLNSLIIIASCCTICFLFVAGLLWFCRKKQWPSFRKVMQKNRESISSIPTSAPPSFRSVPSCVIARTSYRNSQTLPPYVSACHSPPKYEQAIVTQIRDQPENVTIHQCPHYDTTAFSLWSVFYPHNYPWSSSTQNQQENPFHDSQQNPTTLN